jgi:DUF1009 family protein
MLALIAGRGTLPDLIVAAQADRPVICALDGCAPDKLVPDVTFRLERFGALLADLKRRGVSSVCMAGAVDRPTLQVRRLGLSTIPLLPVVRRALRDGDDGALRAVIAVFESAGFDIVGAHDLLPDLVMEAGIATEIRPSDLVKKDAIRGSQILAAMDSADVGQACVVHQGQALAIEGVFGTDWMLNSLLQRPHARGLGGILYKTPKPRQDRRVDLPTIGPATVAGVASAGLDGIVIEAGGVMVLDAAQVIDDCNKAKLFLWIREKT